MDLHVSRWERATTANEAQEERRCCFAGIVGRDGSISKSRPEKL